MVCTRWADLWQKVRLERLKYSKDDPSASPSAKHEVYRIKNAVVSGWTNAGADTRELYHASALVYAEIKAVEENMHGFFCKLCFEFPGGGRRLLHTTLIGDDLDRQVDRRVEELWGWLRARVRGLVLPALRLERLSFQPRPDGTAPTRLLDEMEDMQRSAVRQRVE